MLDQLFETLEKRSFLSQVTFLNGMPADADHERQALEALAALDDAAGGSDDDMYRFIAVEDDAVYESVDAWGSESETYGHLAADVAVLGAALPDVDSAEAGPQEWVNRSTEPGDVDSSALATAVQAAHDGRQVLPSEPGDDRGGKRPDDSKRAGKAAAAVQIRFDFSR